MQGKESPSKEKWYTIGKDSKEWFSVAEQTNEGLMHYSTTLNFVNTNAFVKYFTEERGCEISVYNNDNEGKLTCLKEMASGDVILFFDEDGEVAHIGLVTGIGEWNAYFCANTNDRRDYGAFRTSEDKYAQFGIMHMSQNVSEE